jgi:hypothetical protein
MAKEETNISLLIIKHDGIQTKVSIPFIKHQHCKPKNGFFFGKFDSCVFWLCSVWWELSDGMLIGHRHVDEACVWGLEFFYQRSACPMGSALFDGIFGMVCYHVNFCEFLTSNQRSCMVPYN